MAGRKADVYINNQAYRVMSYQRSSTDDLISRFGSPEKGETNLDILKALTQKSFRGGMFQKEFEDPEMVNFAKNCHYNPLDKKLYFTPKMDIHTISSNMDSASVTAFCFFRGSLYIAFRNTAPTITNRLHKINLSTGVATAVTLPAAIQNSIYPITDLVVHKNAIFICGMSVIGGTQGGFLNHRYDGATTFQDINGTLVNMVSWRGVLYGINFNELFTITNEFAAGSATYTQVSTVGAYSIGSGVAEDYTNGMLLYNNAVYIFKHDGLFRFDGVSVNPVFDELDNLSANNFRLGTVFNGRMYYVTENKLYEFDGTNVSLLQDFSETYYIMDIKGGSDRLWITVRYNKTSAAIFTDKVTGDVFEQEHYTYGLISYNGIGFFEYDSVTLEGEDELYGAPPVVNVVAIPGAGRVTWIFPRMYLNVSLEHKSDGYKIHTQELSKDFDYTELEDGRTFEVYGSEFDMGYPSVSKVLNAVKLELDGFSKNDSNLSLQLDVRTRLEGTLSDWTTVWDSSHWVDDTLFTPDYNLYDGASDANFLDPDNIANFLTEPLVFDYLEYRLIGTVIDASELTIAPRIKNVTFRYTMRPKPKSKWILTLSLIGKDYRGLLFPENADGSEDIRTSSFLRKNIYDAQRDGKPILFYDFEHNYIYNLDGFDGSFIDGTSWLRDGDTVAIAWPPFTINESFQPTTTPNSNYGKWYNVNVSVTEYDLINDRTLFTQYKSGNRIGIGGANIHPVEDFSALLGELRKSYAVVVTRIVNERVIMEDETMNQVDVNTDDNWPLWSQSYNDPSSTITIELVEV